MRSRVRFALRYFIFSYTLFSSWTALSALEMTNTAIRESVLCEKEAYLDFSCYHIGLLSRCDSALRILALM